jgi:hypothetical protein
MQYRFCSKKVNFLFSCKFFSSFGHQKPGPGSVFSLKFWIRIGDLYQMNRVRIRNIAIEDPSKDNVNHMLLYSTSYI